MAGYVAVLEDDAGRVAEMRECLREVLPRYEPVFFDDAGAMIGWLKEHLGEVVLMSLDHDLPVRVGEDGRVVDCGTGRMVADYLAEWPETCPVIVHSSNEFCAPGMVRESVDAGWSVVRVRPGAEERWVRRGWAIEELLRAGAIFG